MDEAISRRRLRFCTRSPGRTMRKRNFCSARPTPRAPACHGTGPRRTGGSPRRCDRGHSNMGGSPIFTWTARAFRRTSEKPCAGTKRVRGTANHGPCTAWESFTAVARASPSITQGRLAITPPRSRPAANMATPAWRGCIALARGARWTGRAPSTISRRPPRRAVLRPIGSWGIITPPPISVARIWNRRNGTTCARPAWAAFSAYTNWPGSTAGRAESRTRPSNGGGSRCAAADS